MYLQCNHKPKEANTPSQAGLLRFTPGRISSSFSNLAQTGRDKAQSSLKADDWAKSNGIARLTRLEFHLHLLLCFLLPHLLISSGNDLPRFDLHSALIHARTHALN